MSAPNTPFGGSNTSFGQTVDVGVSWSDITFSAGDRTILHGLSGNALPRRALAIMGSSGAGKTTFLNALSDRLAADGKTTKLSGTRYLNDVEYHRKFRTMVGYVTQDDVLNPTATPVEALSFSLRVRRGTSVADTEAQVDKMIDELGLTNARDTVVGIPGLVTGLSGGERKRTNIGVELITNPKVLYLDEPTSGLDSVTSAKICQLLKKLAVRGRTVIYTIHQPTAECIESFDDLMLMCKGKVVYHGPMETAVGYFQTIGYECPTTHTPTDFFMTLLQDEQVGDILIEAWVATLAKEAEAGPTPYTAPVQLSNESFTERYLTSYAAAAHGTWSIELTELMKRAFRNTLRNKLLIVATLVQNIVFALVIGLLFIRLKDDVTGVADRMGLLFILVVNAAFASVMGVINNFPPQKAVYIRDQQSGAYSPFLYFLSFTIAELPIQLTGVSIQCIIVYWMTQLHMQAANFFLFLAIMLTVSQVGFGVGYAVSVGIDSYIIAAGVAPMINIPLMLCGGLLASTDRLRPYWYWLEKPNFIRTTFILLVRNEFHDLKSISCDPSKYGAAFCSRQPKTGEDVLTQFRLNDEHSAIWIQWFILAMLFIIGRVICVALLYRVARTKY